MGFIEDKAIRVTVSSKAQTISPGPSTIYRVIMPVVVVDKAGFGVVVLARPLDGLGDIASRCDCAVGGVGIGGADVAGGAVDFADVLRQIPAVGVPGAVLLEG